MLVVGGVGYRVFAGRARSRGRRPARRKLYTHHLVREDLQALYGFRTDDELGFFELLITVTGVGPKVGLAIVSSRPVADLQLAIMQGDEAVLTAVSGVGKRLAGRIVLELKEKVAAAGAARRRVAARRGRPEFGGHGARSRRSATPRASHARPPGGGAGWRPAPRWRSASRRRCGRCARSDARSRLAARRRRTPVLFLAGLLDSRHG